MLTADERAVDAVCGAGYAKVSPERVNRRNGYRQGDWATLVGTIDLAVPKLRIPSHFPAWLLGPRRAAPSGRWCRSSPTAIWPGCRPGGWTSWSISEALTASASPRSPSWLSSLDAHVAAWRNPPLDAAPYTYVWLGRADAKGPRARSRLQRRVVHAVGINTDGYRETLGIDVITVEDGAGWTAFLRGLVPPGRPGVQLVVSPAHTGLKYTFAARLPGASWQCCRTPIPCAIDRERGNQPEEETHSPYQPPSDPSDGEDGGPSHTPP